MGNNPCGGDAKPPGRKPPEPNPPPEPRPEPPVDGGTTNPGAVPVPLPRTGGRSVAADGGKSLPGTLPRVGGGFSDGGGRSFPGFLGWGGGGLVAGGGKSRPGTRLSAGGGGPGAGVGAGSSGKGVCNPAAWIRDGGDSCTGGAVAGAALAHTVGQGSASMAATTVAAWAVRAAVTVALAATISPWSSSTKFSIAVLRSAGLMLGLALIVSIVRSAQHTWSIIH